MIIRIFHLLFINLVVLILLLACKKTDDLVIPNTKTDIDAQILKYAFNKNTYWVYQDQSNASIQDSITIDSVEWRTYKYLGNQAGYHFTCYIVHYIDEQGYTFSDYFFGKQIRRNANRDNPAETGQLMYYKFDYDGLYGEEKENLREVEYKARDTDAFGNRWNNSYRFYLYDNKAVSTNGNYHVYADSIGLMLYTKDFYDPSIAKTMNVWKWHVIYL